MTGSYDGIIRFWDSGKRTHTFVCLGYCYTCANKLNNKLISGSDAGTLNIWDLDYNQTTDPDPDSCLQTRSNDHIYTFSVINDHCLTMFQAGLGYSITF